MCGGEDHRDRTEVLHKRSFEQPYHVSGNPVSTALMQQAFPVDLGQRCFLPRKLLMWLLFAACLALFGLGGTPFGRAADSILIPLKIIVLIFLSVLVVKSTLAKRSASEARSGGHSESILRSFTRWCRGEHKPS